MNPELVDYLLASYGLIEGDLVEVSRDLVDEKIMKDTSFEISSETYDFNEMISFISNLEEVPNRHALFQHTPGWILMLSNSKGLDSFSKYQIPISKNLNRKTVRIVDIVSGNNKFTSKVQSEIHLFNLIDEDSRVVRSVSNISKNGKWLFSDDGEGFSHLNYTNNKEEPRFGSDHLTELVKAATQYDLTLNSGSEKKFVLIEEK